MRYWCHMKTQRDIIDEQNMRATLRAEASPLDVMQGLAAQAAQPALVRVADPVQMVRDSIPSASFWASSAALPVPAPTAPAQQPSF